MRRLLRLRLLLPALCRQRRRERRQGGNAALLPSPPAPAMDFWGPGWPGRGRHMDGAGGGSGLGSVQGWVGAGMGGKRPRRKPGAGGRGTGKRRSDSGMFSPSKGTTEKERRTRGCRERERGLLPTPALSARSYALQKGKSSPERSHGAKPGFSWFQVRFDPSSPQECGV